MKKLFKLLPALLLMAGFSACSEDDNDNGTGTGSQSTETKGAYIVNYGGTETSAISKFDYDANKTSTCYYQMQNGKKPLSNIQWAYNYDGKVYLIGNFPDQILVTDETFTVVDTITENVANPRNCIADGNYLYISCWGESPDWGKMADSYILKYNIETGSSEKIACAGGPEGLEIANGKLYIALNYANQIAVMDLNTEEFSDIKTNAVSSYFAKDASNNLYVTLVSTYSNGSESENVGLGYINTSTDELTFYKSSFGMSAAYAQTIAISNDGAKVYLATAIYAEDGYTVTEDGVSTFDTASKSFDKTPFASGVSGINGVSVNPENNDVYVFISASTTDNGTMKVYSNGKFVKDYTVGVSPAMAIFID
ncbi:MAG: hypothetical protein ACK5LR_07095 [Mangrovibacterium sp.]